MVEAVEVQVKFGESTRHECYLEKSLSLTFSEFGQHDRRYRRMPNLDIDFPE